MAEQTKDSSSTPPKDDDCVRPSCASFKSMLLQSMGDSQKPAAKIDSSTAETKACPVGREDLGRFTWALLHTTAAWFPEKPDDAEKTAARQLVDSLARLYPCTHCAEDFRETTRASPVTVDSRTAFAQWLCAQHNLVNKKLGKPIYDCGMPALDERWREGHPSCFESSAERGKEPQRESLGRDE
mmetsp:Transcript_8460/g.15510  ORF Transcript_8460/g.15510 Transcript_8460/m.15510 type:complete len:184 (+) Transcript_8460:122-673(+)